MNKVRKQLHTILDLLLDIQEAGNDVFFNFSGHVGAFGVSIYNGKWGRTKKTALSDVYVSLRDEDAIDELITNIRKIINQLNSEYQKNG